jgi:hypothetical protein
LSRQKSGPRRGGPLQCVACALRPVGCLRRRRRQAGHREGCRR